MARALVLAMMPALGATACGNVTAGGFGEVGVDVSGDESSATGVPEPAPRMALLASSPSAPEQPTNPVGPLPTSHEVEGHVELEFMLFLVKETGSTLRLGDEQIQVSVDVRGESRFKAVERQLVEATRYTELQIVFTDIRAEVEGLIVDGVPVPEVHVELDDVSLLVSRPVDLDIAPGQRATLVVDLNSLAWLEAVDPLGTVDETVFASLIGVAVE
jgi:hypothetical protein